MADSAEYELFTKLQEMQYVELDEASSKVLKGILTGAVVRQALANVLRITTTEDMSLKGMNLLSDPTAVEVSLRKQGQIMGLVLAIENLLEQAYAYEEEEENGEEAK